MTEQTLAPRVALVTGGGRGIGRACCLRLAEAGAQVAVNYHRNAEAAEETAALIRSQHGPAIAVQADVASRGEVHRMIGEIEEQLGPVDLLVNNAGIFRYVSFRDTTPEIWQRQLDVNLTGIFHVAWAVVPGMIERQFGRIVNIASIAGLRPRPMSIAYSVSKAGVISLTQSTAEAWAPHNIRVNCVAPGLIETEILTGVEQEQLDTLVRATPIQRIGQPQDIAEVVEFLLSERSGFMTGQTVVVDGGRVMLP